MSKKRWIHDRYGSKLSPVFADDSDEEDEMSLDDYRRICDLCNEPRKPGKPKRYGRLVTFVNADKIVDLRDLPELALKLFNDDKSTSFKLLKVCKINHGGCGYYGLTFRAQEDGIKESLVFRGVVRVSVGKKEEALFCAIKVDDDEITLLSCDDDYVGSERACESEDCPPCKRCFMNLWQVPYEMLKMPKLRHLIWNADFHLSYRSNRGIVHESDLQTIETVADFIFTEEVIKILVNLKKLVVAYYTKNHKWDYINIKNLCHLQSLEDLQISMLFSPDPSMTWNHAFPIGLKKLSLQGVLFPWENMTIIGSLAYLQVLEMTRMAVNKVSKWVMIEGQFLQLKYFRSSLDSLLTWEMEKEHFPCLESLILECAELINEIPSGIGEIDTLRYIELWYCKKSLVISAKQMQKHQHENGNDAFRVRVIDSGGYDVLF